MNAIKSNLAWIGVCAILIVGTFIFTWIYRGAEKDKEFKALSGHKDTTMVNYPIVRPPKDTTISGTALPLDPKTKRKIDSLCAIAKEYFKWKNDTTIEEKKTQAVMENLLIDNSWLSEVFFTRIEDDRGKRKIIADPALKSINEIFDEDTVLISIPQINTTFTNTTGIKTSSAIEVGLGGLVIGGVIAKDNKAIRIGLGGIVIVELLKMIF